MKEPVAYKDAVDLLDADHQAVKKMFTIDCAALCESKAPTHQNGTLAEPDLRGPTPLPPQRKQQLTRKAATARACAPAFAKETA